MSPTEEARGRLQGVLEKTKKERDEILGEIQKDALHESEAGFNPSELSPLQEKLFKQLLEKELLIEGLNDLLKDSPILIKREGVLLAKISVLNHEIKTHKEILDLIFSTQKKICLILHQ